jgi:ribA/ribD-fused uncharacterized protein
MSQDMIHFHLKSGEWGWLSNFAPYPIVVDDVDYPTSEHYYQASKFTHDPTWVAAILVRKRPYDAWRMGNAPDHPARPDWAQVKDDIMLKALLAKFTQHATLREQLLATGDATIIEHTSKDSYWGDGGDGSGQNKLGRLLMLVREELRQTSST